MIKKKILLYTVVAFMMVLVTAPVFAKKDECTTIQSGELLSSGGDVLETGFDDWGYNYQARLFNGYYCDAYRDATWCQPYKEDKLMMKWNDAWLSNKDCDNDDLLDRHLGYPSYIGSGAWLTNHQSGTYEMGTGEWDVVGDWVISLNFGGVYVHDLTVDTQMEDGTLTGSGGYQSGLPPYTHPWTMTGTVDGDSIEMEWVYMAPAPNPGYTVWLTGNIDGSGNMAGDCTTSTGQTCTWVSTSGTAEEIMKPVDWNYFVKIVAVPGDAKEKGDNWYTSEGTLIGPEIWGDFAITQEVYNDPGTGDHGLLFKSEAPVGFGVYKP
ncbi:hypothetical protein ACFL0C_00545 [Patescibacteria group bacterium]